MTAAESPRLAAMISAMAACGSSYRNWIPSRFITARPPRLPISTAKRESLTESNAAATIGISNVCWPRTRRTSISSGLTVTEPGTMATSSNP